MTTGGEGGMVVTNNKEVWSKVWSYKDNGKSYDAVYGNNDLNSGQAFKWLHESFGTNYRMTEMQSATDTFNGPVGATSTEAGSASPIPGGTAAAPATTQSAPAPATPAPAASVAA